MKLPDSYNLRALPDLTGTLSPGEVCVVVNGSEVPRPIVLLDGEPFDILVYGAPGMHPGDIRKLRVTSTDALRRMIGKADPSRCNAIFFSIQGERSEQDCIAGGDFDGDKRNAICWQPLVKLVSDSHPPYDAAQASATYAQRFRPSSVAGAPTATLPTPPVDATKLEERLIANYLMARFNSSALVCKCGIAWQLLAEKRGADHPSCLMADHLYRVGLDAMPPDTAGIHTKYLPHLPAELRGTPYPQYVVAKMQSKPSRRTGTAAGSSNASTPKGVRTTASLKSKLYNAPLAASLEPSRTYVVQRDPHLCSRLWGHPGAPVFASKWERLFKEYRERVQGLRSKCGLAEDQDAIADDSPYWEAYRELEHEMRARYVDSYTPAELAGTVDQGELLAEAAAIYEVCYPAAPERRTAAAIKFPFRIAQEQLVQMKGCARKLDELTAALG